MITIVTGLPGHGKTLFTLAEIHREFVEQPKKKGEAVRPIYYLSKEAVDSPGSGIAGLTLEGWTPFTDVYQWWDLPNGSVIVVDECQYCLPRRSPGKEPDWISAFAEHRKKGFDIYLITQDCRNMDYFVRRLAGQHIHYWRPMGAKAATRWEFPKAVDKPDDHFEQKNATSKRLVKHPKAFYSAYASANVHTVKRKIPAKLFLFPVAIIVTVTLIYIGIHKLTDKKPPPAVADTAPSSPSTSSAPSSTVQTSVPGISRKQVISWNSDGIAFADLDKLPSSCVIDKKAARCPYSDFPGLTFRQFKNSYCKTDGVQSQCFVMLVIRRPTESDNKADSVFKLG